MPATGRLRALKAVRIFAVVVLVFDAPLLLAQAGEFQEADGGPDRLTTPLFSSMSKGLRRW